jgi:hypothetical protein
LLALPDLDPAPLEFSIEVSDDPNEFDDVAGLLLPELEPEVDDVGGCVSTLGAELAASGTTIPPASMVAAADESTGEVTGAVAASVGTSAGLLLGGVGGVSAPAEVGCATGAVVERASSPPNAR